VHFLIPKTKLKTRDSNVFNDFSIFGTDSKHKKKDVRTETEDPEAVQVPYKTFCRARSAWATSDGNAGLTTDAAATGKTGLSPNSAGQRRKSEGRTFRAMSVNQTTQSHQ
jgi:hypothetical protein